jgi:hypothetical protein
LVTPTDANGSVVHPFIYNGTTYLPVRAVGDAFGKPVHWDGGTNSVYVGQVPSKPLMEVPLYNKAYIEVGNAAQFSATGNDRSNRISLRSTGSFNSRPDVFENHVVYPLNTLATTFKATLLPISSSSSDNTLLYRIYGDDLLLYTSPSIGTGSPQIPIEVNVSGVIQLKIEMEQKAPAFFGSSSFSRIDGIENAVILTTDY